MKVAASIRLLAAAALLALAPVGASAGPMPPLQANAHVMDSLVAARVADRIRHECPSISGRLIKAFFKAEALKGYALEQGYSAEQIRAFLKDPKAKALIKTRAEAMLKTKGAKPGDAQSYCAVGRAEIAADSLAGSLLRAN